MVSARAEPLGLFSLLAASTSQQGLEVGRMKEFCGDYNGRASQLVIVVGRSKVPTWVRRWREVGRSSVVSTVAEPLGLSSSFVRAHLVCRRQSLAYLDCNEEQRSRKMWGDIREGCDDVEEFLM